ncbi:MAG: orotidine-5'-phosphate decarboxylase [Candidatus Omnitrophota bacterium]
MKNQLIVALDTDKLSLAEELVDKLSPVVGIFKVGSQLFTAVGPEVIERIQRKGAQVFLDLKFHDIPNTVSHAVAAACRFNPAMLTVHTLGGSQMLRAAKEARDHIGADTLLLGVTILTSLDKGQLEEIGLAASVNEEVLCLAQMAQGVGLDGVIASPQEVALLRQSLGGDFIIITPGIRPQGPMGDDQRRTMQAREAILAGANYLVVGRPVTQAEDPLGAAKTLLAQINV